MPMNRPYSQLKNQPSAWQVLFRPMLLVSLGIHGLLLMVPVPSPMPSEAAKPEKSLEKVEISELLAPISSPSPKPSPKKSSTKKVAKSTAEKAASAPRKQVASRPSASKSQSGQTAKQTSGSATDSGSTSGAGEDGAETSDSTTEAPEGFADLFGGKLAGEVDEKLIDSNVFEKPESFYTKTGSKPETKPGVEKIKWISLKRPDDVLAELKPQLQGKGIQVITKGKYGGGTVYQVKKGKAVRYLNLVPAKSTSIGTLIVVWSRNPNASAKTSAK